MRFCLPAAVAANEKLPRHEIIAKMIKQAQHMDSLAAEEIKSALGHELKPPLHGQQSGLSLAFHQPCCCCSCCGKTAAEP